MPRSKAVLRLRPIGRVRGDTLLIHRRLARSLDGIEGFSHVIVLFWLHAARKPSLKLRPKGRKDLPLLGTLATRTPHRFNPIGMTVVRLLKRKGRALYVKGLDAWDGTPILDLKPYTRKDSIRRIRIPGWVKLLDKTETDPLRKYAG